MNGEGLRYVNNSNEAGFSLCNSLDYKAYKFIGLSGHRAEYCRTKIATRVVKSFLEESGQN
jgi:hypothetical protein